jgi:hypothetical protein
MNDDNEVKKNALQVPVRNFPNLLVFFGTVFYPYIKIKVPGKTREAKVQEDDLFPIPQPSDIVLDIPLRNDKRIIVYQNGHILISYNSSRFPFLYEKKEKEKAVDFLNLIFAEALFSPTLFQEASRTLVFEAVRQKDVASLALDANTLKFVQGQGPDLTSLRHIPLRTPSGQLVPGPTPVVSVNTIEEIIQQAERTRLKDSKRKERIVMLLESWTHILNCEFAESFTLSWLIIEKRINDLWERQIDSQLKTDYASVDETDAKLNKKIKDRRSKLENYNLYTTDTKLEMLKFLGVLTLDQYDQFMRFKDVRNGIAHARKTRKVSYHDAHDLWNLIFSKLWARSQLSH